MVSVRMPVVAVVLIFLVGCTGSANQQAGTGTPAVTDSADRSVARASGARPGISPDALPFPEPRGGPPPISLEETLDAALPQLVNDQGLRGITAAVVTAEFSWSGAAGMDGDGVLLVPSAMMGIGSITKGVTAAEVMSLAQAGLIDLDASAADYLDHPLLAKKPTVRQLLSHTSGVPDFVTDPFWAAMVADPLRHWAPAEALSYATGPITEPGRPFESYSSSNYLLLGLLIEKVTGTAYPDAVRNDVLSGIGPRMVIQDAEAPAAPLAAPTRPADVAPDGAYLADRALASAFGAAGGIAADAPTLATWGYRLYGGLILPPDRTVELTTPVVGRTALGTMILGRDFYGPGAPLSGEEAVGHNGTMPGYTSLLVILPADRLSIAIDIVGPDDLTSTAAQFAEDILMQTRG